MKSVPASYSATPLDDRLLAVRTELLRGGESLLSKINQYLSSLPKHDTSFFSQSIKRKDAGTGYYPFAASLTRSLSELEQTVLSLCNLLEECETAMAIETLSKGGQLLECYLAYKREINAALGEYDSLLRRHDELLSLAELQSIALRLRYQTEEFLATITI